MTTYYRRDLKNTARTLRKTMTRAEIMLWRHLRRKQLCGVQFYRQKPIGVYIADFYCPAKKLIIEVDGGHHFIHGQNVCRDVWRDRVLEKEFGLRVLRFSNDDVYRRLPAVIDKIMECLS